MTDNVLAELSQRPSSDIELLPNKIYRPELQPVIAKETNIYLQATLYLLNDDIEGAHRVAQSRDGDEKMDLVHCILHRREGDFWNSCEWIKLLTHPALIEIWGNGSTDLLIARKNADAYVRRVETWHDSAEHDKAEETRLKELQHKELSILSQQFVK